MVARLERDFPLQDIELFFLAMVNMRGRPTARGYLGCPQEGMMYAQVITPGYLMVLEA